MKKTIVLTTVLMLLCSLWGGAAGEAGEAGAVSRVRNAEQIQWASGDYAVADGCMIRMSDGEVLFDSVSRIDSTGGWACIGLYDGTAWIMDAGGNSRPAPEDEDGRTFHISGGQYGLFFGSLYREGEESDRLSCVYDPERDACTMLSDSDISDVYQDPEGRIYVLTEACEIFRANGEQILGKGEYSIAWNCNFNPITNGYLTVFTEEDKAAVLSPYTGEVICRFEDSWMPYDANHEIYRDNTAFLYSGGTIKMIVGLDGTVLKELPENQYFDERCETEWWYSIYSDGRNGKYIPATDRTYWFEGEDSDPEQYITCEETGERFAGEKDENGNVEEYRSLTTGKVYREDADWLGDHDPAEGWREEYRPAFEREYWLKYIDTVWDEDNQYRVGITGPDGRVLGNRYWKALADGWGPSIDGIEGYHIFSRAPVCAVEDENGLCGLIDREGRTVLPAEFEKIDLIGAFSADPMENGHNIAAKKNGLWYVFDEEGKALIPEAAALSGEEAVTKIYASGDYEYVLLDDGRAEIVGYAGADAEVTIPAEVDGKETAAIGARAFMLNGKLSKVVIPEGVTTIRRGAFAHCGSLASVTIPDSVTTVEGNPFHDCRNLREMILSPEHPALALAGGALTDRAGERLICCPGGLQGGTFAIPAGIRIIGDEAFHSLKNLRNVTIPDSVTAIGENAFRRCVSLQSVTIPKGVVSIGNSAFQGCRSLGLAMIPGSVTEIGDFAFQDCESLRQVTIPGNVAAVGKNAFCRCRNLASVTIRKGVKAIGDYAFAGSNLGSVTIPDGVTSIGKGAFSGCHSLRSVTVPDSVTAIGDRAFYYCEKLNNIRIPKGVTAIGEETFFRDESLETMTLPEGLESIGKSAFCYCPGLLSMVIPDSVTSIANDAFASCEKLVLYVSRGSYAMQYCQEHNRNFTCESPATETGTPAPEPAEEGAGTEEGAATETVELNGFTLHLKTGTKYTVKTKEGGQTEVTVTPFAAEGDTFTSYNCSGTGKERSVTVKTLRAKVPDLEKSIREQLAAGGSELDSVEASLVYEGTLNGEPCVIYDSVMNVRLQGIEIQACYRLCIATARGANFVVIALGSDRLEAAAAALSSALVWE